jgi:hypothetical protein
LPAADTQRNPPSFQRPPVAGTSICSSVATSKRLNAP